ncbi:MAG TPA: [FeFe] hydrogenase H-cluster radical SAM maturase HydE [Peptococcaceae bacterium]|nr:[FeFe] hydrogenase H-cluster radical SAM maturase HydE [Peptococcaceae bacterium]
MSKNRKEVTLLKNDDFLSANKFTGGENKDLSAWLNKANKKELADLLGYYCREATGEEKAELAQLARELGAKHYGSKIFFRGLIEFSSYCRNDCFYCGLRRSNSKAKRYRLTPAEILECCQKGYEMGFRTFVLQSGEDAYYTDDRLCGLISKIKELFPDCAVTLSIGERSYDSYKSLFEAGADRYLLRHETANEYHYSQLHPPELSLKNRLKCLYNLKEIGFQVGAGFMVDSPDQTFETLAEDFIFLRELQPHMIGIGPFIPHHETRFANYYQPTSSRTLVLLSLLRIMLPKTLLPATTALGTVDPLGRQKGLQAGANVLMLNLTPLKHRSDYSLYDNKLCTGWGAAENLTELAQHLKSLGFTPDFSRGDYIDFQEGE